MLTTELPVSKAGHALISVIYKYYRTFLATVVPMLVTLDVWNIDLWPSSILITSFRSFVTASEESGWHYVAGKSASLTLLLTLSSSTSVFH